MTRDEIMAVLRQGVCRVVFTKKDGTVRTMDCTLNSEKLDEEGVVTGDGAGRIPSQEVVPVYSLGDGGWRSFRVDSLQSIDLLPSEAPDEEFGDEEFGV